MVGQLWLVFEILRLVYASSFHQIFLHQNYEKAEMNYGFGSVQIFCNTLLAILPPLTQSIY